MQIKHIILFAGLTMILLHITDYQINSTLSNARFGTVGKINGVINHDLDYELTVWGASTSYVNINPQVLSDSLGLGSFNMGIDGTNIDQYSGLLNEFLGYTKKSKYLLIALDINGGLANRTSLYNVHNWIQHIDNQNIYEAFSEIDDKLAFKMRYIPYYKLTLFDKHAFSNYRMALEQKKGGYEIDHMGYNPVDQVYNVNNDEIQPFNVPIDSRCLNKIDHALKIAQRKGIKCYIIVTPCYKDGYDKFLNRDLFKKKIFKFQSENVKVLDFSESYLSSSKEYFYNNTHLNSRGANAFSKMIGDSIKVDYK